MRSHREDDYRLPEGVRPLTHRLKAVGYTTGKYQDNEWRGDWFGKARPEFCE